MLTAPVVACVICRLSGDVEKEPAPPSVDTAYIVSV